MHTDEKTDPLAELGYEQKDIAPKHIFKASMIFFGFALGSWAVVYLAMHLLGYFNTIPDVNNLKSAKIPGSPNPVIQTNITAKTDIRDMRQHENEVLATSGPSEHSQGLYHIPIEQAIKLTAERKGKVETLPIASPNYPNIRKPASNAPDAPDGTATNTAGGNH